MQFEGMQFCRRYVCLRHACLMSAEEVIVKKIDHSCYKRNNSLQLSVRIYRHNESLNESRSRYARFVHYELVGRKHRVVPRGREPSRVPVKRLALGHFYDYCQQSIKPETTFKT